MSTALWVSVLVVSHVLAAVCLFKALLLSGKGQRKRDDVAGKAGKAMLRGPVGPATQWLSGVQIAYASVS